MSLIKMEDFITYYSTFPRGHVGMLSGVLIGIVAMIRDSTSQNAKRRTTSQQLFVSILVPAFCGIMLALVDILLPPNARFTAPLLAFITFVLNLLL